MDAKAFKDHRAKLAEIEKHWRAPVGTPGHKLDVLVTAVRDV
jgi:hypothetical protein